MLMSVVEALASALIRVPRSWDGKDVSKKGTLASAFRTVSGDQAGLTARWASHHTAISDRHLWIGRTSVAIAYVIVTGRRTPTAAERWALDADFTIVRVGLEGAELEWGLRESALDEAIRLLGSVTVQ